MKNTQFRRALERELLLLRNSKSGATNDALARYRLLLLQLHRCNVERIISQSGIYTAAKGSPTKFISEFLAHLRPFIARYGKSAAIAPVRHTSTNIIFSPQLTEIALGCMMRIFLSSVSQISFTISASPDKAIISAQAQRARITENELLCIQRVAHLHGGRAICEFSRDYTRISISLPSLPQFQPLKFVPCHPELCRICRI